MTTVMTVPMTLQPDSHTDMAAGSHRHGRSLSIHSHGPCQCEAFVSRWMTAAPSTSRSTTNLLGSLDDRRPCQLQRPGLQTLAHAHLTRLQALLVHQIE